MAVAVRKPNGEIVVKRQGLTFFSEKSSLGKLPLLRGVLTLVAALVLGIQALNFSANQALPRKSRKTSSWTMSINLCRGPLFRHLPFLPRSLYLTKWNAFCDSMISDSGLLFNLVDGVIRLIIFLLYLWGISFSKEIRRVFSIPWRRTQVDFCIRSRRRIDVDRVKGYSRLHPRSDKLLLIVMVVSILVFALLPHSLPFGYKVASRVVFIPLIAGISYEIIRFADRKKRRRASGISFSRGSASSDSRLTNPQKTRLRWLSGPSGSA